MTEWPEYTPKERQAKRTKEFWEKKTMTTKGVEDGMGDERMPVYTVPELREYATKMAQRNQPSTPAMKDEVYAMLAELNVPGQLCGETVRILMPHLEDAVKWRKR